MNAEDRIREELAKVESDSRLDRETATVHENAPLALIQLKLETKRDTLEWVLEVLEDAA